MASVVFDLTGSDDDSVAAGDSDHHQSASEVHIFPAEKPCRDFFAHHPVLQEAKADKFLKERLEGGCTTLSSLERPNIFPNVTSFISAAGADTHESLAEDGARSGSCQFATISMSLYGGKGCDEAFRPDIYLRKLAVDVIRGNPSIYQNYLVPALNHSRTRSAAKSGGWSVDMKKYLNNMALPSVDGDAVTLQALCDLLRFKVRVIKWEHGEPIILTNSPSLSKKTIVHPMLGDLTISCPNREIFLVLQNNHYKCLLPTVNYNGTMAPSKPLTLGGEEPETCTICLEDITSKSGTKLDCCTHVYHVFCILEESKRSTKCPQCRREFRKITRLERDPMKHLWSLVPSQKSRDEESAATDYVAEEIERLNNAKCTVCERRDGEDTLMGCSNEANCHHWAHAECVGLESVPEGDWFCGECGPCDNAASTISAALRRKDEEQRRAEYIEYLNATREGRDAQPVSHQHGRIDDDEDEEWRRKRQRATTTSLSRRDRSFSRRRVMRPSSLASTSSNPTRNVPIARVLNDLRPENDAAAIECMRKSFLLAAARAASNGASANSYKVKRVPRRGLQNNRPGRGASAARDRGSVPMNASQKPHAVIMRTGDGPAAGNSASTSAQAKRRRVGGVESSRLKGIARERGPSEPSTMVSSSKGRPLKNDRVPASARTGDGPGTKAAASASSPTKRRRAGGGAARLKRMARDHAKQAGGGPTVSSIALVKKFSGVVRLLSNHRTEHELIESYKKNLERATFELAQVVQKIETAKSLINNGILPMLGTILSPTIDGNGKTVVPRLHVRRRIIRFLAVVPVERSHLRGVGVLIRALIFYSTRRSEQPTLRDEAGQVVSRWRCIARGGNPGDTGH
jgi:hypothetical protein